MRLKPLLISCSVALCSAVLMAEEGLAPAQATIKATAQIRGAVIGITLVLVAVFLPMAFFPGSIGGIYRQFSVTLATSIAFSAVLALTLTPALCATLLKPHGQHPGSDEPAPVTPAWHGYRAITLAGQAAPGVSSGTALDAMERLADKHLIGKGNLAYEWTGAAYEEKQAGSQIDLLLGLSALVVFLLLAALYNSWTIPLAVLLVVPMGVLGAVLATWLRGFSADVYFNIGLVTIIGLAAKNAILIVEFAMEEEARGKPLIEATLASSRQRLRPILMTSLAFILGMVPLVIASGAGSASRQAVGTGVAGGMIAATVIGIYLTPLFYAAARTWLTVRDGRPGATEHTAGAQETHA